MSYTVGLSAAGDDNVVCAAAPQIDSNDGVFSSAGNGSPNTVYGNAVAVDTIKVTNGQQIYLTCDSNNNAGSSVGVVSLPAMKIGKLTKQVG